MFQEWAYDSHSKTQNAGGPPWSSFWGAHATHLKLSSIPSPTSTFMFTETAENLGTRGYNVGSWVQQRNLAAKLFSWVDLPALLYGGISTWGYTDGHAESHQRQNADVLTAGKRAGCGQNAAHVCGPTSLSDPDSMFVHDGYRHPN